MFNILARTCIALLIVTLSGCSTLSIPDWVEGKSEHYITKTYLLGHGLGQNVSDAEESAARLIILQFKSVTTSEEQSSQANIIFNQIEFEEPWLNTNTNQHHVLAYVSRDKIATLIQNKMLALDELTYQFFEQAKATTDLLEQTSFVNSAINAQVRRIKLKPLLKIILSEYDTPSAYNVARLTKVREQLQKRINLKLDFKSDSLGELDLIMKRSLDAAGFIRNENNRSSNHLLIELTLDEQTLPLPSGLMSMKGTLDITLNHDGDDSIRGQYQWKFDVTAKDRDTLIKKSREILTTKLNANLKKALMDMMLIDYEHEHDDNLPNQDYLDFDMPEFNKPDDNQSNQNPSKTKTDTSGTATDATPKLSIKKFKKTTTVTNELENKKSDSTTISNNTKNANTMPDVKSTPTPSKSAQDKLYDDLELDNDILNSEDPIGSLPPLAN